jgi:hypothetical protein
VEKDDSVAAAIRQVERATLWHYTDAHGLHGIRQSLVLLPSLREANPKDARYGDGQYLSDVPPGSMSLAQLSRRLVGVPWQVRRFTHYVEVDVTGLARIECRSCVILIPGREPLQLDGRIVSWGANEWSGT